MLPYWSRYCFGCGVIFPACNASPQTTILQYALHAIGECFNHHHAIQHNTASKQEPYFKIREVKHCAKKLVTCFMSVIQEILRISLGATKFFIKVNCKMQQPNLDRMTKGTDTSEIYVWVTVLSKES